MSKKNELEKMKNKNPKDENEINKSYEKEEEERVKKEEAKKGREEDERKRREEEERLKKEEERLKKEEEEKIRKEEEERLKREEEEKLKRKEEERLKKEEEKKIRKEEEERIRKEEERERKEEERLKREEEERIKKEEEERIKREEEERIKREEEENRNKREEDERVKNEERGRMSNDEQEKKEENGKIQKEGPEGIKNEEEEIIKVEEEEEERIKKEEENDEMNQEIINQDIKPKEEERKESENILLRNSINKNSKLFLSLSDDQKNYIITILKDINNFKSKQKRTIDDIENYPTITIDINKKENTLDDLIKNFSNIIKRENKEEIEKRKNFFINKVYFEGIIGTNPLLDFIPECNISHVNLLKNIYTTNGLKNIPSIEDDYDYENIIFNSKNLLISEYYSPIGKLEDLKGFISKYNYNYEENSKIIINSVKAFNYWRSIQGDGNSFYRTFMFSLIEYYILYNNKELLEQIISEISCDDFIEIYKEYNVNYNICFIIFGVIIQLLSKNKIEKAYDLFLKSYLLKDGSFDKILIIYLRYISFMYVNEVIELSKDEMFQEDIEDKKLINSLNEQLIKTMNVEPDFFIICLMPYLFDINITVLWIDKDLIHCKDGIINFIDEENGEILPLITLGYFYSSYHKIYSNTFIQENEFINSLFQNKINNLTKLTLQVNNPKKCEICKKDLFIVFLEQKFKICKNCLQKYINNICSFRNDALNKGNYIGQEYYTRAFNLKDEYILNDYEFIEIKEDTNIINYIQHIASIVCSKCKGNFDKKNLNHLKCKCLLCDKCLEDMILNMTSGLKILNSYEKRNLANVKCSTCGNNFSYEDAIEHLKDIKEKDNQNAINRMSNYINTLCLICGDLVREKDKIKESYLSEEEKDEGEEEETIQNKNKDNYKTIKNYKKIRVRKENEIGKGINYLDIEHVICFNCYENSKANIFSHSSSSLSEISETNNKEGKKEKNNIKNLKKEKSKKNMNLYDKKDKTTKDKYYIDFEEGECFCFICNKKHYLIDKRIKNGGCCTSGCIIH